MVCSFIEKLKGARKEKKEIMDRYHEITRTNFPRLTLKRNTFSDISTISDLFLPTEEKFCLILEDTIRRVKVDHKTAIPAGVYEIAVKHSNRYNRPMPYLLDVPYYTAIMIHWGNTAEDSSGCLITGALGSAMQDFVGRSKETFEKLFTEIDKYLSHGKLFIDIQGGYRAEEWAEARGLKQEI